MRKRKLSTLEKLAKYFHTDVKQDGSRKYVQINKHFVIDNGNVEKDTLLVSDGINYVKIKNNNKAFLTLTNAG